MIHKTHQNLRLWRVLPNQTTLRRETQRFFFLAIGTFIASLGYVLFQLPHGIVAGGIGGIAIVINHFTGWPAGLLFWVLNIPMLILGFFYLGRWPFLWRTLVASTLFSIFTDLLSYMIPDPVITQDMVLNTIYGGVVGGIGGGIIYRTGSTMGGSGVIGRIIQNRTGFPLSQSYLFTDGTIIFVAALLLGWEIGLYGLMMLLINGMASDYIMEGVSNTRIITIITDKPHQIIEPLTQTLNRGITHWEVKGGYTGNTHTMIQCTVYRSQVSDATYIISRADEKAFVTIGVGHQALGEGFNPLRKKRKTQAKEKQ